jgi:2',3'-cyclic-nucleotide 2'-phosphodiesterase
VSVLRALILGDVVGMPGCRAVYAGLSGMASRLKADVVIANGENAAGGRGVRPEDATALFKAGVQVITSGNHIWQQREIFPLLESEDRLLRPENYPTGVPGKGHCLITVRGVTVGVLNLQGREHLPAIRCPFRVGRESVARLAQHAAVIIVDFHAEAPGEKEALAYYLDGKCALVFGTHTHVQTADERILAGGTGFITDIGMTGPAESAIGMSVETAIKRGQTQMPLRLEVEERAAEMCGILVVLDTEKRATLSIERIREAAPL